MLPLRLMGASSLDQETEGREAMVAPVRAVLSTLRRDSVEMIGRVYRRSARKRRNYFLSNATLTLHRHSSRSEESLFHSFSTYFTSSTMSIFSSAFRYSTTTSKGTGPYSAETASRICCVLRLPSAKFNTS